VALAALFSIIPIQAKRRAEARRYFSARHASGYSEVTAAEKSHIATIAASHAVVKALAADTDGTAPRDVE